MNTYVPKPCCKTSFKRSLLNVDMVSPSIEDEGGGGILKLLGIGDERIEESEWLVIDDGGGGKFGIWDSLMDIRVRWESASRNAGLLRWIKSLFNDISEEKDWLY